MSLPSPTPPRPLPSPPLPRQAAFTPKELRELLGLEGVRVALDPAAFRLSPACEAELKGTRMKKRVFDILAKALAEPKEG